MQGIHAMLFVGLSSTPSAASLKAADGPRSRQGPDSQTEAQAPCSAILQTADATGQPQLPATACLRPRQHRKRLTPAPVLSHSRPQQTTAQPSTWQHTESRPKD